MKTLSEASKCLQIEYFGSLGSAWTNTLLLKHDLPFQQIESTLSRIHAQGGVLTRLLHYHLGGTSGAISEG